MHNTGVFKPFQMPGLGLFCPVSQGSAACLLYENGKNGLEVTHTAAKGDRCPLHCIFGIPGQDLIHLCQIGFIFAIFAIFSIFAIFACLCQSLLFRPAADPGFVKLRRNLTSLVPGPCPSPPSKLSSYCGTGACIRPGYVPYCPRVGYPPSVPRFRLKVMP